jgi:signal transduction histidine kinase
MQWLDRVSRHLARSESVRETFYQQLADFYDALVRAVETGDAALLNPVLEQWSEARTQTELEDPRNSLPLVLNQILLATHRLVSETLSDKEALEVMGAFLPIYSYALERTSILETQLHVRHVSLELGKAKNLLERLEKSKSDFIAVAAHELKTPLTLIEGYTAMLKEAIIQVNAKASQSSMYLKGINGGTRRLREIVDDMIDVSMIDNDLLSLTFQPIWVNRLLDLVRREVADTVKERKLKFIYHPFEGIDEMTFGDGERLLQAFRNVITNAIKYTPDGGTISIDGRLLPGFIEIIVSDTGIGIDPEDHSLIFEKFGRLGEVMLHSSGKTKFKGGGPGLGLPITKGIIEAHGGTIWVESKGHDEINCPGSTFHILLPLRKSPPDDNTAKLFRPLAESKTFAESRSPH